MMFRDYVTTNQVSSVIGLSPDSVRTYAAKLPGFPTGEKVSGRIFYKRSELIAWAAARERAKAERRKKRK